MCRGGGPAARSWHLSSTTWVNFESILRGQDLWQEGARSVAKHSHDLLNSYMCTIMLACARRHAPVHTHPDHHSAAWLPQAYYAAKGIKLVKGVLAKELKGNDARKVRALRHSQTTCPHVDTASLTCRTKAGRQLRMSYDRCCHVPHVSRLTNCAAACNTSCCPKPRHVLRPACVCARSKLQVTSVTLSDGSSLPADLVVVGAGARPASSLVK